MWRMDLKGAEYEDYSSVSKTYDELRVPVGLDSLSKALDLASQGVGKPVDSLKLLDVGCGTGNYINVLKDKVGSCTGLEFNEGMLATAKAKHQGDDRVSLFQGSAADASCFESDSFDVVIMTQVLHHLSMEMQNAAFSNIQRTLKPGGVFWIESGTQEQFFSGFWFSNLIPQATAAMAMKIPGIPLLKHELSKAGLKDITVDIVNDPLVPLEKYLNIQGPFEEEFRNSDSSWSLASKEELEAGLIWWKEQIELGLAEKFLKDWEEKRMAVGQSVGVTCVKPSGC